MCKQQTIAFFFFQMFYSLFSFSFFCYFSKQRVMSFEHDHEMIFWISNSDAIVFFLLPFFFFFFFFSFCSILFSFFFIYFFVTFSRIMILLIFLFRSFRFMKNYVNCLAFRLSTTVVCHAFNYY